MSKLLQKYLRFWAKYYLRRAKPKIVAITGSVGKTSTKEAIFEVLKIKYGENVRKSFGNLNNESGVPLAIFGFTKSPKNSFAWLPIVIGVKLRALFGKKYQVLVLELAADKPGDIKYLTDFIKPDIACITSIGPAHLEAFETLDNIVREKTDLLRALKTDGWAVINIDDENLHKNQNIVSSNIMTYSVNREADVMAKNITTEIADFKPLTNFQVAYNGDKFRATLHTLGRKWNIYSALAAVCIGRIFEMTDAEITAGLQSIMPEAHRMAVVKGQKNTIIIDDCYNANPVSMRAALDVLKDLPITGRKIAVLGDMLEIGNITGEAHQLIGEYAKKVADEVVSVGNLAKMYNSEKYYTNTDQATEYLLANIAENDIILIKASRAVGLEKIVEKLEFRY